MHSSWFKERPTFYFQLFKTKLTTNMIILSLFSWNLIHIELMWREKTMLISFEKALFIHGCIFYLDSSRSCLLMFVSRVIQDKKIMYNSNILFLCLMIIVHCTGILLTLWCCLTVGISNKKGGGSWRIFS